MTSKIQIGDRLLYLSQIPTNSVDLIYVRPIISSKPSTSNHAQLQNREQPLPALDMEQYLAELMPVMSDAYRILSPRGTLYFHVDFHNVHYCKARLLDKVFGRNNFINEIIWWTDTQIPQTDRMWQPKHNYILVYVKNVADYTFNVDDIERIPYMAPTLVGPEKELLGKLPTDTWLNLKRVEDVVTRIVKASSNPGEMVLDFYAGDGVTGDVCLNLGRQFILIDSDVSEIQDFITRTQGKPGIEITVGG